MADATAETYAIAEEHCLEFVHHYVGDEPIRIKTAPHVSADIFQQCVLNRFGLSGEHARGSVTPSRPGDSTTLGKPVVVDHCADNAASVFPQMIQNASSHRCPRFNAAAAVPLTGVPYNPSAYCVAPGGEAPTKNIPHETLFGFSLYVYKQSYHPHLSPLIPQRGDLQSHSFPRADQDCNP